MQNATSKAELILFKLLIPLGAAISHGIANNYIISAICVFIAVRMLFQKFIFDNDQKAVNASDAELNQ